MATPAGEVDAVDGIDDELGGSLRPMRRGGAALEPYGPPITSKKRVPSRLDLATHLLFVASQGDVEGVAAMLEQGCDVNAADYDGRSALHLAASEGKTEVVKLLLSRGAAVNPVDRWGGTPLHDAKQFGFTETEKVLVDAGGILMENARRGIPSAPSAAGVPEWEVDPSEIDFKKGMSIGKGAFGEIRLAWWRGTKVAVKTILPALSENPQIVKEFLDELSLLPTLRHPNIVQFLGAVTQSRPLMLITEYLPKGDLYDIIRRKGALDKATAVGFALDLARGMNYLHSRKPDPIVHRDLKPRNLLRDEAGHLKVADFGLSKLLKAKLANEQYVMTGETGSYRYMAPEVYRHEKYDKSVDVFSFAMIVQEMFEGQPAWKFQLPQDVANYLAVENVRPEFKAKTYPSGMKQLIKECWDPDPAKRPTFTAVIELLEEIEKHIPGISLEDGQPRCNCTIS